MTWVLSCQEMPGGVESETICRTQDPGEADWSLRALWIPGCGLPSLPDPALSTLAPCISASAEKMPSAGPTPLQGQRGHPPPSHSAQCVHAMLWTVARQAPLSMGFSRREYWSGLPCPLAGDLPDPGIEPASLTSPSMAGGLLTTSTTCGGRQGFHQLYLHGASQSHTEKGIFFFFPPGLCSY